MKTAVAYVTNGEIGDLARLRASVMSVRNADDADIYVFHSGTVTDIPDGVSTVDFSEKYSDWYGKRPDRTVFAGCKWPAFVFARFLIPEYLGKVGYDRVLYLDTDVIVTEEGIGDLVNCDMNGFPILAVPDPKQKFCFNMLSSYGFSKTRNGGPYCNSGVLLMDCGSGNEIRDDARRGFYEASKYRFHMPDQDAMNLFMRIGTLPERYNSFFSANPRREGCVIVHYSGSDKSPMYPEIVRETIVRQVRNRDTRRVVSMTTHGRRATEVGTVLSEVCRQAADADATVVLTVYGPDLKFLTQDVMDMDKAGKIQLLVSPVDVGSNLKYYAAMMAFETSYIMVHDDDVVFPDGTIGHAFSECEKENSGDMPPAIVCRRARKMKWSGHAYPDKFGPRYPLVERQNDPDFRTTELRDCFPEGCRGIVFPPGCFREMLTDLACISDMVGPCKHDDDVMIGLLTRRTGCRLMLTGSPGRATEVDYFTNKNDPSYRYSKLIEDTSLWNSGQNGNRTTECLRHFARELWFYGR